MKLTSAREAMVDKHYRELCETTSTTCDSPVIRKFLYEKLRRGSISYSTTVVGHGADKKRKSQRSFTSNAKLIMKCVNDGCYDAASVLDYYDEHDEGRHSGIPRSKMVSLFSTSTSHEEKFRIITKLCESDIVDSYFSLGNPRKPIKKIYLR